jgi:hypothetical protein
MTPKMNAHIPIYSKGRKVFRLQWGRCVIVHCISSVGEILGQRTELTFVEKATPKAMEGDTRIISPPPGYSPIPPYSTTVPSSQLRSLRPVQLQEEGELVNCLLAGKHEISCKATWNIQRTTEMQSINTIDLVKKTPVAMTSRKEHRKESTGGLIEVVDGRIPI